jgi:hypothetical protein
VVLIIYSEEEKEKKNTSCSIDTVAILDAATQQAESVLFASCTSLHAQRLTYIKLMDPIVTTDKTAWYSRAV